MPFQKGKPRPPLRVKTCAICRKSFQPSSGAQKICGEPECKARSRMQRYLDKAKRRKERVISPVPARRNSSDLPGLELDFSPLAAYVKSMIDQELKERDLTAFIREVVREELASRLKPLFGMVETS